MVNILYILFGLAYSFIKMAMSFHLPLFVYDSGLWIIVLFIGIIFALFPKDIMKYIVAPFVFIIMYVAIVPAIFDIIDPIMMKKIGQLWSRLAPYLQLILSLIAGWFSLKSTQILFALAGGWVGIYISNIIAPLIPFDSNITPFVLSIACALLFGKIFYHKSLDLFTPLVIRLVGLLIVYGVTFNYVYTTTLNADKVRHIHIPQNIEFAAKYSYDGLGLFEVYFNNPPDYMLKTILDPFEDVYTKVKKDNSIIEDPFKHDDFNEALKVSITTSTNDFSYSVMLSFMTLAMYNGNVDDDITLGISSIYMLHYLKTGSLNTLPSLPLYIITPIKYDKNTNVKHLIQRIQLVPVTKINEKKIKNVPIYKFEDFMNQYPQLKELMMSRMKDTLYTFIMYLGLFPMLLILASPTSWRYYKRRNRRNAAQINNSDNRRLIK